MQITELGLISFNCFIDRNCSAKYCSFAKFTSRFSILDNDTVTKLFAKSNIICNIIIVTLFLG